MDPNEWSLHARMWENEEELEQIVGVVAECLIASGHRFSSIATTTFRALPPLTTVKQFNQTSIDQQDIMSSAGQDERPVFFFDLDNCLYSQNHGISQLMGEKIQAYFAKSLRLTEEDARLLHKRYYKDYGLALQGLIKHHHIDPLEYNADVDDALPLDECLKPDQALRKFLESIDRTKCRTWILTNAYINHAKRVLKLLDIEDQFEGITYCNYTEGENLICKPYPEFFARAMTEAGVQDKDKCFFVDDSLTNIDGAIKFGWKECVHFREPLDHPTGPVQLSPDISYKEIHKIEELAQLYPPFFES